MQRALVFLGRGQMRQLSAILLGVALATPGSVFAEKPPATQAQATFKTVNLPVKGMACQQMCGTRLTKALKAIDGVERVVVSAVEGYARITYAEAKVKPNRFIAVVKDQGFEPGAPIQEK